MFEKWGRFSYAHRRLIPAIIVAAILALFIGFGLQLEDRMSQEGWEDPGADSTTAAAIEQAREALVDGIYAPLADAGTALLETADAFTAGGHSLEGTARALYIHQNGADTLYRLHGTFQPWSIGKAVSSGCIRLLNQDVIHLYDTVRDGSPIVVYQDGLPGAPLAEGLAPSPPGNA